jgi:antitoxin component HigA of HigAB toxin-antitoxin module
MTIRPIRSEADYETALEEIEALWEAEPGTAEGARLDNREWRCMSDPINESRMFR